MKLSTFTIAITAAVVATCANAAQQGQPAVTPCASTANEPIKGHAIIESHDESVKGQPIIESHDSEHPSEGATTSEPWFTDDKGVVHIYGKPTFSRQPTPAPTSPDSGTSSAPATAAPCGHKGVPLHHKRHHSGQPTPAPTQPTPAPTIPTWAPDAPKPDSNNPYAIEEPPADKGSNSGIVSLNESPARADNDGGAVGKAYAADATTTAGSSSKSSGIGVPLAVGGCIAAVVGVAAFAIVKRRRAQAEDEQVQYASQMATPV